MKKIIILLMIALMNHFNVEGFTEGYCESPPAFYTNIFGGASFLHTEKRGGITPSYRTGYMVSGSFGYRWCYGLRLEAEYAYRRNSLSHLHLVGRNFNMHGHFQSSSYMANILYDFPLSKCECDLWGIQPFCGGGIGYDIQQIRTRNGGLTFRDHKKHFAWQVIAGLGTPLFCNTTFSLEYKFHKGGFHHIYCHSLGLGLTYDFVD